MLHRGPDRQSAACVIFASYPWTRLRCEGSQVSEGKVLRIDGPFRAQGFLSLTAFQAEGCGIALSGDEYKVSVTGLAVYVIWHDKHSVIGSLRSPPPFPLRGTSPYAGGRIKRREAISP